MTLTPSDSTNISWKIMLVEPINCLFDLCEISTFLNQLIIFAIGREFMIDFSYENYSPARGQQISCVKNRRFEHKRWRLVSNFRHFASSFGNISVHSVPLVRIAYTFFYKHISIASLKFVEIMTTFRAPNTLSGYHLAVVQNKENG